MKSASGEASADLVQLKQTGYIEAKSPTTFGTDLENGALRAARGSVSVFAWTNLGMAVHMAAIGVVYGTISGVIYAVLNNYLHMSATLVATATALVQFPRSLRLFTGMLTDTVPIFGYRRRPYMLLGWGLCALCCLLMTVIPLGEPYYDDPSLAKLDPATLTPAQLEQIDEDAPQRGIKLIVLMMLANMGTVVAYSGFNGVLIDLSQREPAATRGTAMGEVMVVLYICSVFSSFFTGLGLNSAAYGGSFDWTIGFNGVMGICAGVSLCTLPFSWFCIQEDKVDETEDQGRQSVFVFLYGLLQRRLVAKYVAFRFFYNVFALFSVTASSAIQSTWAGVEPVNNGIASMLAAFVTMIGTYLIKRFGLGWNWRVIIVVAQCLVVCIDVFPTMLTVWNVVRNQWLWLGVPLLEKIPFAATDYVGALFMLEVESEGFEATLFGLAVTSQRVGTPFATVLTKSVDAYLDIERSFIQQDTHHVRSQVTIAYMIAYAVNLAAIAFVFLLPQQKKQLHEEQKLGRKSKPLGIAAVCVLAFALFWSLLTNVLSLFPSTKCLRVAGGSGC